MKPQHPLGFLVAESSSLMLMALVLLAKSVS